MAQDVYLWARRGRWYYRAPEERTYHSTGIDVKRSRSDQGRSEALAWALTKLARGERRRIPTLQEYTQDFFRWGACAWIKRQHAKGRSFGRGVAANRRAHLDNHLLPAFGHLRLDKLNAVLVENWLLGLQLSNGTKNDILNSLRIILREAKRERIIAANPLDDVEPMANTYRKRDILELEEIGLLFPHDKRRLLEIWQQPKWAALFYLLASTGLRVSEAAALCWRHVIWEYPALLLVEQAVKAGGELGLPKNNDARAVLLPRRTRAMLLWWQELSTFTEPEHYIFWGEAPDRHLNRKTISHRFPEALEVAGIEMAGRYLSAHSLRTTYNSRMRKILPEALLQFIMGHKSRAMTERYTRLAPAERLRSLLPAPPDMEQIWR